MLGTYPITSAQLDIICQFIASYTPPYYLTGTDFINDLYVTGCRPNELLDSSRWVQDPGNADQWELSPEKNNIHRFFLKSILSNSLNTAIINQSIPYNSLTLRQLEYLIHVMNPVGAISTINKEISAYMFRYNRVRNYVKEGKTQPEITDIFGWRETAVMFGYTFRQLYSVFPTMPAETYFLIDADNYAIIDSDGSKILDS